MMNNWGFTVDNPKKKQEFYNLQLCFYNFVQSKREVWPSVIKGIANCMNSYFSLVFTVEEHENFPYNIFVLPLKLKNC